jgi:cytochrome P450
VTAPEGSEVPLPSWIVAPGPPEFRTRDQVWSISRHADIQAALRHPGVAAAETHAAIRLLAAKTGQKFPHLEMQCRSFLVSVNSPWHPQGRQFLRQALRRMDAAMSADVIGALAETMVAALPTGTTFDAMQDICDRLPAMVMARGFGVPEAVVRELALCTSAIFGGLRRYMSLRVLHTFEREAARLNEMLVRDLSGTPVLDEIRAIGRDEQRLGDDEMNALLAFLILASRETTSTFFGNTLRFLALRPDVAETLRGEPTALPPALDEFMRFGSPGRFLSLRLAIDPLDLGGHRIPPGAVLRLETERSHFDAAAYPDPGRFDLRRRGPPTFGFGGGQHACIGMALAREEASALFGIMTRRYDMSTTTGEPDWADLTYLRRLSCLPLLLARRL